MTTATDWDVTDTETGEHPVVTDVTSAAPLDGPIYTAEDAQRLAMQNASLAKRVGDANTRLVDALEQNDRLQAELDTLRAELHPLDERRTGWTPRPSTMPAKHWTQVHRVADLTEQQQRAALVAPTLAELRDGDSEDYLGATVAAELMTGTDYKPGWPTWLGDVHHADATLAEQVTGVRSWADTYAARPVERTVVETVAVDYSYRQSEAALYARMVVDAAEEHVASVYDPEYGGHIYDADRGFVPAKDSGEPSPPDDGWNRDAAFDGVKRHQPAAVAAVRADAPPTEPPAELEVHPKAASSVGGWRTWVASVALGVSAFGTLGSLLWLAGVL